MQTRLNLAFLIFVFCTILFTDFFYIYSTTGTYHLTWLFYHIHLSFVGISVVFLAFYIRSLYKLIPWISGLCVGLYLINSLLLRAFNLNIIDVISYVTSDGLSSFLLFAGMYTFELFLGPTLLLLFMMLVFGTFRLCEKFFVFNLPNPILPLAIFLINFMVSIFPPELHITQSASMEPLDTTTSEQNYVLGFGVTRREKNYIPAQGKIPVRNFENLESYKLSRSHNIFLFVTEGLRDDFIDKTYSPNLWALRNQSHIKFQESYSNANATEVSLELLFKSQHPLLYNPKLESLDNPVLKIFQNSGYKINVWSASDLDWNKFSHRFLGNDHAEVTSYKNFIHDLATQEANKRGRSVPTFEDINKFANGAEADQELLKFFLRVNPENLQKSFTTIMLNSTHYPYHWGENFNIPFPNFRKSINFFQPHYSQADIELSKNAYKNSVAFADSIFGKIIEDLKQKKLYNDAIIVVTGDHGEEFFEQRNWVRGSRINITQTRVPLFYKIPASMNPKPFYENLSSHIDIIPSLYDLLDINEMPKFLDGKSVFKINHNIVPIAARNSLNPIRYFGIHENGTRYIFELLGHPQDGLKCLSGIKLQSIEKRMKDGEIEYSKLLVVPEEIKRSLWEYIEFK